MIEEQITYIYLVENCYGDPNKVYIGKNRKGATTRRYKHSYNFGKNTILTFIDQINSWDRKDWKPLECYWIEQFRQWGFETQNKNPGGGGVGNHSLETCIKISESMTGKKMSKITRKRMSKAKKGKFISPMKGKIQSQETIQKRTLKNKGKKRTEETRIKMSKSMTGIKRSQEFKNIIRKINSKKVNQYDLQDNFIKEYNSLTEAAFLLGKPKNIGDITSCCQGKQKTAWGFKWKYK